MTRCGAAIPSHLMGCPLELGHAGRCVAQSEITFYGSVEAAQYARMTLEERRGYSVPASWHQGRRA